MNSIDDNVEVVIKYESSLLEKGFGFAPSVVMSNPKISFGAKGLYCYLASYANNNREAFPSVNRILSELNISKPSFYKYRKELIELKLVFTKEEPCGYGTRVTYVLPLDPKTNTPIVNEEAAESKNTASTRALEKTTPSASTSSATSENSNSVETELTSQNKNYKASNDASNSIKHTNNPQASTDFTEQGILAGFKELEKIALVKSQNENSRKIAITTYKEILQTVKSHKKIMTAYKKYASWYKSKFGDNLGRAMTLTSWLVDGEGKKGVKSWLKSDWQDFENKSKTSKKVNSRTASTTESNNKTFSTCKKREHLEIDGNSEKEFRENHQAVDDVFNSLIDKDEAIVEYALRDDAQTLQKNFVQRVLRSLEKDKKKNKLARLCKQPDWEYLRQLVEIHDGKNFRNWCFLKFVVKRAS